MRGQFPTQAEDALISLAWLEAARAKAAGEAEGKIAVGIDVAEAGEDETVMVFRQGPRIVRTLTWPGREAQHEALSALLPYKGLVEVVNYDSIGVGAYFAENIEAAGFNIQPINVQYSRAIRRNSPISKRNFIGDCGCASRVGTWLAWSTSALSRNWPRFGTATTPAVSW